MFFFSIQFNSLISFNYLLCKGFFILPKSRYPFFLTHFPPFVCYVCICTLPPRAVLSVYLYLNASARLLAGSSHVFINIAVAVGGGGGWQYVALTHMFCHVEGGFGGGGGYGRGGALSKHLMIVLSLCFNPEHG